MKYSPVIFALVFILSCKSTPSFDRENDLFAYMKDVFNIHLSKKHQLCFLLSNKVCNCSGDPTELIPKHFANNTLDKIILLEKKDTNLINVLSKINHTKIYIDTMRKMEEYGLSNSTDFIFELENKKIVYWNNFSRHTDSIIGVRYDVQ